MDTDEHLTVLRQAAAGTLPTKVDSRSSVPVRVIEELVGSGHISAIDDSSLTGPRFEDPRITTEGREYLRILEDRAKDASVTGKLGKHGVPVLKWIFGIVAVLIAAYLAKQFIG